MSGKLHPLHSIDMLCDYMRSTGEYFDPQRCTGRTEALALLTVVSAIRSPHMWIVYKDHNNTPRSNEYLGARCRRIVELLGYEGFTFRRDALCFGVPPHA